MDVTPFLELKPAPRVLFDTLSARHDQVRFYRPGPDDNWEAVTWGSFAAQIREFSLFLRCEGFRPGERAAIFAQNSVEWAGVAMAIQAAGGVLVPIYPASTAEQAAYVALHSDARFLIVGTNALLGRVFEAWERYQGVRRIVTIEEEPVGARTQGEAKVMSFSRAIAAGKARDREDRGAFERLLHELSLDQDALLLYTSGTSGPPKGVPLTHRNVGVNGRDWLTCNAPLLEEGDIDLLWLPMSHIFGYGEVGVGTLLGFTTYLSDPQKVLTKMPEVRPTVFMSVPSYWEKLAAQAMARPTPEARKQELAKQTGGRLRFCLSGGAGLRREVKELFHECGLLIIEGYGLTEASPSLTLNRPDAYRFDSVGKPLPSVELRLATDGEILAKGPNVFSGYHKDPEATREAFTEDGWLKTGDIGRFTEDGFLQIVDRKKDILVTAGGKNVAPANIEIRFRDDPLIAHVVVYGDDKRYLVAGIWLNEEAAAAHLVSAQVPPEAREETLRALVAERVNRVNAELASYETIKRFAIISTPLTVESGLLTASLKVRRKLVHERFRDLFEGLYA